MGDTNKSQQAQEEIMDGAKKWKFENVEFVNCDGCIKSSKSLNRSRRKSVTIGTCSFKLQDQQSIYKDMYIQLCGREHLDRIEKKRRTETKKVRRLSIPISELVENEV